VTVADVDKHDDDDDDDDDDNYWMTTNSNFRQMQYSNIIS